MSYLTALLSTFIHNEQTMRLALMLLVGGAVFSCAMAAIFLFSGIWDPVRQRLQHIGVAKKHSPGERWTRVVEKAAPVVLPKSDWERRKVTANLVRAGYRSPSALSTYYGVKVLLAVVVPVVVLIGASRWPNISTFGVICAVAVAMFVGVMLPNYVLSKKVESRQRLLREGFPDALDLIVVCVEAGLGLHAAIERVSTELALTHPVLAEELEIVNAEIRAGVDRSDALKNLARRTGLEDIQGLVALLVQNIRFGTSVAETLRVYAEEFRDKRMQAAEELAAKVGTKMIFPLIFCLFPSFFLVAIGPGILGVLTAFPGVLSK